MDMRGPESRAILIEKPLICYAASFAIVLELGKTLVYGFLV